MGKLIPILLLLTLAGCGVVDPTLLGGPVAEGLATSELVNASVIVLQDEGYTVITADSEAGVVTTDWRAESSFAGQLLLQESHRTRISVVVDLSTHNLSVQMTRQVKDGNAPWRNRGLTGKDNSRLRSILSRIQARSWDLTERKDGNL